MKKIKVIHLEDNPYDAELIGLTISGSEVPVELIHVSDKASYIEKLKTADFELILSDYNVPDFEGNESLELAKKNDQEIPFIYVTGKLGEKVATEVLVAGATDYVLKHNLEKLPIAIKRAHAEYKQSLLNKEQQKRLKMSDMAIENAGVGIMITDHSQENRPIIYVNKMLEKMSGYSAEELKGRNPKILQGTLSEQEVVSDIRNAINRKGAFSGEIQNVKKDGTPFWVSLNISPIEDDSQGENLFVGVMKDITKEKILEKEIIKTNQLFEEIQNVAEIGLWNYHPISKTIFISGEIAALIGKHDSSVLSLEEFLNCLSDGSRSAFQAALQKAELNQVKWDIDLEMINRSGSSIWVRQIGYPIMAGNKVEVIRGLIMNNDQKKRAEIDALKSNKFAELVFNSVNDILCLHDLDGTILRASPSILRITGYLPEIIEGNKMTDFLHPEDDKQLFEGDPEKWNSPDYENKRNFRFQHKDGHYLHLLVSAVLVRNELNEVTGIATSSMDISEHVQRTKELKQKHTEALKFQSMLLSTQINPHFIFNALNAVQYYILDQKIEAAINFISDFSTLMRGVLSNSMKSYIPLKDELDWLDIYLRLERDRFSEKFDYTIEVKDDIDPYENYIPSMLLQPFVENAIIHGVGPLEQGGLIEISIGKKNDQIICEIEDNGKGRNERSRLNQEREKAAKRKSYGVNITTSKISLLNELEDGEFEYQIIDKVDENDQSTGTKIIICYPESLGD